MRGRPPLPTHLKVVRGTLRNSRVNPNEPEATPCLPSPPGFLDNRAVEEWHRVAPDLYRLGLLSELDVGPLAAYCQSFSRWCEAEDLIAGMATKDGTTGAMLVKTHKGNAVQNPLLGI